MWTGHAAEWQDKQNLSDPVSEHSYCQRAKACGALLYKQLWREQEPENTLLLSAPGNGKTTLLRDLIRLFSNGDEAHPGKRIGLVDERSEIAGCLHGIPQNDLGSGQMCWMGARKWKG